MTFWEKFKIAKRGRPQLKIGPSPFHGYWEDGSKEASDLAVKVRPIDYKDYCHEN